MRHEKGQALVEYMLMLMVVAAVGFGVYKRVKDFVDEDGESLFAGPFSALESDNPKERYKKFRIIR